MSVFDWIVLGMTVFLIVGYGIYQTRGSKDIQSYLLGGNEAKWWTVGLSVMATQASAITFLSTPGQAYNDGMGFAQFYLMLPVAMIIICVTFIPIFYKLKVYTAYQFLENRFDLKTRSLTAGLFLIQRGLATGITIYAPAIILSSIIGWNLQITTIVIGLIAVLYTVSGGTKAVHVTHKLQMIVIFTGLIIIFFILMNSLPDQYSFREMLQVANANDKLEVLDFKFDWKDRYNVWTSLAALFLFLSYFGTDQSQVQRYISGQSIRDSKLGLLMNGLLKVPLQFFILFLGVLVFLFFQFEKPPVFFNENTLIKVRASEQAHELATLQTAFDENYYARNKLHTAYLEAKSTNDADQIQMLQNSISLNTKEENRIRDEVKAIIKSTVPGAETNDKDYVFINYILNYLPKGLVGLLLAVILFAAMSSTSSELNALGSTTSVDIYKRSIVTAAPESHYLSASKWLTFMWGMIAILFASFASLAENLIQFVNIIGSIFYGTILGIFLIAFYMKFIKKNAVFYGALMAEIIVIYVWYNFIYVEEMLSFLWLNIIGCLLCIILASILSVFMDKDDSHYQLDV
jgi:SSS family transporter